MYTCLNQLGDCLGEIILYKKDYNMQPFKILGFSVILLFFFSCLCFLIIGF